MKDPGDFRSAMDLAGKVIVVTGSGQGIGKAYALALANEKANVVISDIQLEKAKRTAAEIESLGGQAFATKADVSLEADTVRLAKETVSRFGKIDVLVNNAAVFSGLKRRPFFEIEVEEWDRVFAVNVRGIWFCTKAVFPYMKERGKGKIVNVSSGSFFAGTAQLTHYVASKGAVVGITRALSHELGAYNITINAIAPGYTLTEASRSVNPGENSQATMIQRRALKRNEYPEDLVGTMIYLCSRASDFVTGQTIIVDGGLNMH